MTSVLYNLGPKGSCLIILNWSISQYFSPAPGLNPLLPCHSPQPVGTGFLSSIFTCLSWAAPVDAKHFYVHDYWQILKEVLEWILCNLLCAASRHHTGRGARGTKRERVWVLLSVMRSHFSDCSPRSCPEKLDLCFCVVSWVKCGKNWYIFFKL